MLMRILTCFCLYILFNTRCYAQQSEFTAADYGFIENKGQLFIPDDDPLNGQVYFVANINGIFVAVTASGLSYYTSYISANQDSVSIKQMRALSSTVERVDLSLGVHIQRSAIEVQEADALKQTFQFITGSDIHTVKGYRRLRIKNLYPGIHMDLLIKQEKGKPFFKYEFVVSPGADVSDIVMNYSNNSRINTDEKGNLHLFAKYFQFGEQAPVAFTSGGEHPSIRFMVNKNTVGFDCSSFNRNDTLTIDPDVVWTTMFSSVNPSIWYQQTYGRDIETDSSGNIYLQLTVVKPLAFPTKNFGSGAYFQDTTTVSNGGMVLMKFSPSGKMLWSTYYGTTKPVRSRLAAVSANGDMYAIGQYVDGYAPLNLKDAGGFYDTVYKGYFIIKLDTDCKLKWASFFCPESGYPMDMTIDPKGHLIVAGWATGWEFITVDPGNGAYAVTQPKHGGAQTLFLREFDDKLNIVWSTRIEGNDYDPAIRVHADKLGNIYIGGDIRSTNYPFVNAGGYFSNSVGTVLTRFDKNRKMDWSTAIPGIPFGFQDIVTDDENNVYYLSGRGVLRKFGPDTKLIWTVQQNSNLSHWYHKIVYDRKHKVLHMPGLLNDLNMNVSTVNAACGGSFYYDTKYQFKYSPKAMFATYDTYGNRLFETLTNWPYEYYEYAELTVDINGDPHYLFFQINNHYVSFNPDLKDYGNGAYYEPKQNYEGASAMLMKLRWNDIDVKMTVTPPTGCNASGSVTTTMNCGSAPFTYLWSNGAATANVSGLTAGKYWVKITDASGRIVQRDVDVPASAKALTQVTLLSSSEHCDQKDGVVTVQQLSGGTAPFSYMINGNNVSPTGKFEGLSSGNYTVTVSDAAGCKIDQQVTVGVAKPMQKIHATMKKTACDQHNGQVVIDSISGGTAPFSYAFNSGNYAPQNIYNGLSAGSYPIAVKDSAGCYLTDSIRVLQHIPPTKMFLTVSPDHCNKHIGSIHADSVSGGTQPFLYSFNGGAFQTTSKINNIASGMHTFTVKDSNGCLLSDQFNVIDIPGPQKVFFSLKDALCGNLTGAIKIDSVWGTGPFSYALNTGIFMPQPILNAPSGTHALITRDSFGCTRTDSFTIYYSPIPAFTLSGPDTAVCYNSTVRIDIETNAAKLNNLVWNIPSSGNAASIVVTQPLQIKVSATDTNGCPLETIKNITVKACNPPDKCVAVASAFTPNSDGRNDLFGPVLHGCRITDIHFAIFNRAGKILFESKSFDKHWDGKYQGILQDPGVYVYICRYKVEDNSEHMLQGTVVLLK